MLLFFTRRVSVSACIIQKSPPRRQCPSFGLFMCVRSHKSGRATMHVFSHISWMPLTVTRRHLHVISAWDPCKGMQAIPGDWPSSQLQRNGIQIFCNMGNIPLWLQSWLCGTSSTDIQVPQKRIFCTLSQMLLTPFTIMSPTTAGLPDWGEWREKKPQPRLL